METFRPQEVRSGWEGIKSAQEFGQTYDPKENFPEKETVFVKLMEELEK